MATIESTALVPALLETASLLSASESALATPTNNIQIAYDIEAGTASINANIPFVPNFAGGELVLAVTDYAPVASFDATAASGFSAYGAGGTNIAAFLCRLAEEIDSLEQQREANNQPIQPGIGVSLSANYDTRLLTVTSVMPITQSLASGVPTIAAVDYLA